MKKIFYVMIAGLFFASAAVAKNSVDSVDAENFIKKITREGLVELINSTAPQKEKDEKFKELFNEALDLDFIGQFVLGRYWKTANKQQKTDFISVYRELNVKTWSKRFDDFKGKEFVFQGTSPSNSPNQLFVDSSVEMDANSKPISVVWRVKQNGDNFKVVDIIIENVSLAITARNEYSAFIKNSPQGVDGLINSLKEKVAK